VAPIDATNAVPTARRSKRQALGSCRAPGALDRGSGIETIARMTDNRRLAEAPLFFPSRSHATSKGLNGARDAFEKMMVRRAFVQVICWV